MVNPFETLGLGPWATAEEVREAYRALAKRCHPDAIQDPEEKQAAQERMVQLNLAYEEALKIASPSPRYRIPQGIPAEDALRAAERLLEKNNPEGALRQLMRSDERNDRWYYLQGKVMMQMRQYETAHQSVREAIRLNPERLEYRSLALEAYMAHQKEKTPMGKFKKFWRDLYNK